MWFPWSSSPDTPLAVVVLAPVTPLADYGERDIWRSHSCAPSRLVAVVYG